jgi:hypothetical protein
MRSNVGIRVVSEGGLELLGHGGHRDASTGTERHPEQARQVADRQPGDIGGQPDTSAAVSPEVSRPGGIES